MFHVKIVCTIQAFSKMERSCWYTNASNFFIRKVACTIKTPMSTVGKRIIQGSNFSCQLAFCCASSVDGDPGETSDITKYFAAIWGLVSIEGVIAVPKVKIIIQISKQVVLYSGNKCSQAKVAGYLFWAMANVSLIQIYAG